MTEDDTILGRAIGKIADDAVRRTIEREVELLRASRKFGLVFDRHLPESVRLLNHPIRPGVTVGLRDESTVETWKVAGFTDRSRVRVMLSDGTERDVSDLVVIREFGESVHLGLRPIERIERGRPIDRPHVVIKGENFHALQLLRATHRGKVDLIYIDPPYNTGNDGWIYNDRYVDTNDRAKSSKWLSFMERRLTIARELLKPTGVIIVAIGDDEHHRLRMLMDQVFGVSNFISNVVWNGSRKNDATFVSNAADYMLAFAKDASVLAAQGRWNEPKHWAEEVLAAGADAWHASGADSEQATKFLKAWFRRQPRGRFTASQKHYSLIDTEGRVFSEADPGFPNGEGPRYDVLHPVTGVPCRVPERGWRFNEDVFKQMIADGRVHFRADHTALPRPKTFLAEQMNEKAESVFYVSRKAAPQHVGKILGNKRFAYPKDHEVLMRWFRMVAPKDAVIVDFFAGSGSTAEAVIRLNAEDGGFRQSILVTNNEVGSTTAKALRKEGQHPGDPEWESKGVFEYVTRPRITTVVTGVRPDGSEYGDRVDANVEFLELAYLDPGSVRRGKELDAIEPVLSLESEGGYAILTDLADIDRFVEEEAEVFKVYVVTDSEAELQLVRERLPIGVEVERLYEPYLRRFEGNTEDGGPG